MKGGRIGKRIPGQSAELALAAEITKEVKGVFKSLWCVQRLYKIQVPGTSGALQASTVASADRNKKIHT